MTKLLTSSALLFLTFTGPFAWSQEKSGPPPNLVKVKDDIYILQNQANTLADLQAFGGNATVLLTGSGVILVDSKSDPEHDDLMAKLKTITDKPVKYVILTHNHGDHTGGAAKLQAMGATLVISEDDRENMVQSKQPGLPEFAYTGQAKLTLGGKTAELYQFRGHTRGDTVVYFPSERVIVLGDLLTTADTIPSIVNYGDGGSWADWTRSIDQILKMDFDVAIPGHGPMVDKAQVAKIRGKMVAVQERVRGLVRERKTQEEISQTLMKEFNWGGGPSAGNVGGMMMEFR